MIWKKQRDPKYNFTPQPDITAFELATIATHLGGAIDGGYFYVRESNPIPPNLMRHFTKRED